jgi:hypothetical protein
MDELGANASSFTTSIKVTDHQYSSLIPGMPHQNADINNQVPQHPNFFFSPDCKSFCKLNVSVVGVGCSGGLLDGTGVGGRGGGSEVEAPSIRGWMLRAAARAQIRLSWYSALSIRNSTDVPG